MKTQRDALWEQLYIEAKQHRDVILISADMGAPSLDQIRRDFPHQFVNTGIAEQNAILVGSGLAKEGKDVFVYAIASFLTLNCIEKIRVQNCMMKIPLHIVGVGAGFSYADSGPTHHLIEDLSVMRSLPNMNIFSITDAYMAKDYAANYKQLKGTNYVRLDRQATSDLYQAPIDWDKGFCLLRNAGDVLVIATGSMTHQACELQKELPKFSVLDLYRFPVDQEQFYKTISKYKQIITLEEHVLAGGLGSYVLELLSDGELSIPVKRCGITNDQGYCYRYGGREELLKHHGLDKASLAHLLQAYV